MEKSVNSGDVIRSKFLFGENRMMSEMEYRKGNYIARVAVIKDWFCSGSMVRNKSNSSVCQSIAIMQTMHWMKLVHWPIKYWMKK